MISAILMEPETPGNVGAAARALKNFGHESLVLINPKCDHLCSEARDRASHAIDILERAETGDESLLDRFDYLAATTSKLGKDYNIPRVALTPRQLAGKLAGIRDRKTGIVFGREPSGLSNEEITKCDFAVSIPSSSEYPALNLSHAVAVVFYELSAAAAKGEGREKIAPVSGKEKKLILGMVDSILGMLDFSTTEKLETQRKVWKRMVGKSFMTRREALALMGFLKKIMGKLK